MKLLIIDGHNYLYRAFYAIKGLTNSKGEPTNAIYGVVKMLLKLLKEENPTHLAVAFDSGKPSLRTKIYPQYKSTRPPMPDELRFQLPIIKDIVSALGIATFESDAIEADDLIATLVEHGRKVVSEIIIVSSDKDLFQLIDGPVKVLNDRGGKMLFDPEAVKQKLGIRPDQMIDYLALMGDHSDNVPGVTGVGKKSAAKLLNDLNSLDNIYANLHLVKAPALRNKLAAEKDMAYLSKKLVTCDREVPLEFSLKDLEIAAPDNDRLLPLLKRCELNSLVKVYHSPASRGKDIPVEKITSEKAWLKAIKSLSKRELIAVDLVINEAADSDLELLGIGLYNGEKMIFAEKKHLKKSLIKGLTVLESSASMLVGCGTKTLYNLAARDGIELTNKIFDVKIASYLINPLRKRYNLAGIWDDISNNNELANIEEIDSTLLADKELGDVLAVLSRRLNAIRQLFADLSQRLSEANLLQLYTEIEQPLTKILAYMEKYGIKILQGKLEELSAFVAVEIEKISSEIYQIAGEEFNLNSSLQLGEILFQKLGLPVVRKTKTGYSTDIGTLEILSEQHPLPEKIIGYRQLAKLKSTYLDTLPTMIRKEDGRIHTQFHQTGTTTGRLSSSEPNLQNIPAHSKLGKKIREAFISESGWSLLSADYSQMELRVLAHFSADETLIDAFEAKDDIHSRTAAEIFHIFKEMVTPQMRKQAKAVNFGVIYGLGAFSLSRQLKISRSEAQSIINRYFERYENVAEFIKLTVTEAKVNREVRTLASRRRMIPEIMSSNKNQREFGERAAVNTVIQGSSADIIKLAMIKIDRRLKEQGLAGRLILQIHDELIYEVPDDELDTVKDIVVKEMKQAFQLKVPLDVDITVGKNWAALH